MHQHLNSPYNYSGKKFTPPIWTLLYGTGPQILPLYSFIISFLHLRKDQQPRSLCPLRMHWQWVQKDRSQHWDSGGWPLRVHSCFFHFHWGPGTTVLMPLICRSALWGFRLVCTHSVHPTAYYSLNVIFYIVGYPLKYLCRSKIAKVW